MRKAEPMDTLSFSAPSNQKPRIPRSLFRCVKDAVLGPAYGLSVAFVDSRVMRTLNQRYRGVPSATDILSFPLSKMSGEIVFSMNEVKKQAPLFGHSPTRFLAYLFIHGLLHLKGYRHGSKMEAQEQKLRRKFNI